MPDRSEYQLHYSVPAETWAQKLSNRDAKREVRRTTLAAYPARPGAWDYAVMAAGTIAVAILRWL